MNIVIIVFMSLILIAYIAAIIYSLQKKPHDYEIKTEVGMAMMALCNADAFMSLVLLGLFLYSYYQNDLAPFMKVLVYVVGSIGILIILLYFFTASGYEAYKDDYFYYSRLGKVKKYHIKEIDRIRDLGIGIYIYFTDGKRTSISLGTKNKAEIINKLIERHNALEEEAEKEEANIPTA